MRMPNAEVNRLGDRLRASETASDGDLVLLQDLRREYEEAMFAAQTRLAEDLGQAGVTTSRLKTVQTLTGKLRREPHMNLAQVQDIAGLRVVREMTLEAQTELAMRIAGLFEDAKVIDRRAKPSHGYRAVHVVAKVDGRPVEIQVRTALQDRWAQIVEKMADLWGRQIRYGLEPDLPDAPVGRTTRAFIVELVRRLGPIIEAAERSGSGRELRVRTDIYAQEVARVLSQIASLPALNAVAS